MPGIVMVHECRRAVTSVFVLVLIPVLLGFAALTIDLGVMFGTRADLQRSADAAAMAAIEVLANGENYANPLAAATEAATDFVQRNTVMGHAVTIDPATDLIFGRAVYDWVTNTYDFIPDEIPTNAIRVIIRQTADSPNGRAPLYFAGIFGIAAADVSAQAAAMFVGSRYDEHDCNYVPAEGEAVLCAAVGDCSVDSDDSSVAGLDDSSGGGGGGDSGDDSDDSDDSGSAYTDCFHEDSRSGPSGAGSLHTIVVDAAAVPGYLAGGAVPGPCSCFPGDPDVSGSVQVCHVSANNPENTFVLTLAPEQLAGHLAHGDTLGDCPGQGTLQVFLFE